MKHVVRYFVWSVLVFVVTLLPFGRAAQYGVVNCDDLDYVGHAYKEPIRMTDVDLAIWMPLTWASYKLDYWLADVGKEPSEDDLERAYHVMHGHSALIHAVNAALLFLLLALVFRGRSGLWACAVGALVWALHPLRCESVCWIASRKDVLSMLGVLLALLCWVRHRTTSGRSGKWAWYAGALLFFVLGVACKPSAMLVAPLAFVLDWLVLGCVSVVEDARRLKGWADARLKGIARCGGESVGATPNDGIVREMAGKYLPYVVPGMMSLAVALFSAWAQAKGGAMEMCGNLPLTARIANAMASFGIYLKNTVWPFDLAAFSSYRWPEWPRFFVPGVCLTLLVGAGIVFFCVRVARGGESRFLRGRFLFAALIWFCIGIFPFIGIKAFGAEPFADRFTYIPSVGWSLLTVAALTCRRRRFLVPVGVVVLLGLGVRAFDQAKVWENDKSLWEQTLAVDGEKNSEAWASLGLWNFEIPHDIQRAGECFRHALDVGDIRAGRVYQHYMLALYELGKMEEDVARKVYNDFAAWDMRIIKRDRESNPTLKNTTGFLAGRLIYLYGRAETRDLALKEMKELLPHYRQDHFMLYASYLMGLSKKEEFLKFPPTEFFRFRFVNGKCLHNE